MPVAFICRASEMRIFLVVLLALAVAAYFVTKPRLTFDAGIVRAAPAAAPTRPWVTTGRTATLQEGETLTEILLTSPITETLDVRCLRHVYNGQVSLVCPGVSQDDMVSVMEDIGP